MQKPFYVKILLVATLLLGFNAFAQDKDNQSVDEKGSVKAEIKEFIAHHLLDSHHFTLFTIDEENNEHFGFPLPVILWDNGLKVFSSSKLDHGQAVAEVDGEHYALYHGKIVKTDAQGTINYDAEGHATNVKPLDFSITKNVVFIILVSLLLIFMFSRMAKTYKGNNIPKGIGRALEPIILYIRDDIAIPNIGEKHYRKYMGYLLTVFFFIWIINLLGLSPLGVNVTNNIAVTFCLAIFTFFITAFTANKNYWKHIFWMPGVPVFMKVVLAPIELLGTLIKPFSLMIRLYANITAGHLILMSILGMMFIFKSWMGSSMSFVLASALSFLELLVAALQAYIFTMLSALYFGMAVEEPEDH
ncbi:F0F1 ATP synthase subunit A [Arenibacter certesii]|uniref:ATP synthase subunit a n=1 Tax=Arenibacter certesii TaxID=228955 RepID=A0A918J0H8_9FLAO|nr:F0F1 ATP synthase subunit A [Arenibacter certesii]GGW38445.1 ATP synthase subunit a [Arenibacter certesii]